MGLKEWGTGMVIFAFVGVQTAHAAYPFEPKKNSHTHLEKCEQVRTPDNIVAPFLLTGTRITPKTGSLTIEGHQPRVG